RIGGTDAGRVGRRVVFDDKDVVDADPFVVPGRVRGDPPELQVGLVAGVFGQQYRNRGDQRGGRWSDRRVGDERIRHVRERPGVAEPVLQRDRLDGIVGRAVDVPKVVGDANPAE